MSDGRLPRRCGEAGTPTSNQPPRCAQGRKLLGPAALHTCPFASLLSQVRARLGPGGYGGVLGMGVPRLACLRPAAWLKWGPSTTQLHQLARVRALWGGRQEASPGAASLGGLTRRRRDQGRVPREVPVTQAMTIETRRVPGGRRPAQRPCFPFGAKGASTGQGIRQRLPFRCNKTKTSRTAGWRSSWSPGRRHRQSLWQARTNFSQDKCTRCAPLKWPIVGAHLAEYFGRGTGPLPINRTSHPQGRGIGSASETQREREQRPNFA